MERLESRAGEKIMEIRQAASSVIVGKEKTMNLLFSAILAGGHVLLEDLPGTGKTLLAKTLAKTMDLEFGRIQFTPDLMPFIIIIRRPENLSFEKVRYFLIFFWQMRLTGPRPARSQAFWRLWRSGR